MQKPDATFVSRSLRPEATFRNVARQATVAQIHAQYMFGNESGEPLTMTLKGSPSSRAQGGASAASATLGKSDKKSEPCKGDIVGRCWRANNYVAPTGLGSKKCNPTQGCARNSLAPPWAVWTRSPFQGEQKTVLNTDSAGGSLANSNFQPASAGFPSTGFTHHPFCRQFLLWFCIASLSFMLQGCLFTMAEIQVRHEAESKIYFNKIEGITFSPDKPEQAEYLIVSYRGFRPMLFPDLYEYYAIPLSNNNFSGEFKYLGKEHELNLIQSDIAKEQLAFVDQYRFSRSDRNNAKAMKSKRFKKANSAPPTIIAPDDYRFVGNNIGLIPYAWCENAAQFPDFTFGKVGSLDWGDPGKPLDPRYRLILVPWNQPMPISDRILDRTYFVLEIPVLFVMDVILTPFEIYMMFHWPGI